MRKQPVVKRISPVNEKALSKKLLSKEALFQVQKFSYFLCESEERGKAIYKLITCAKIKTLF